MTDVIKARLALIESKYGENGKNFTYNTVANGDAVNVSYGRVSEYWIFKPDTAELKDIWVD